MRAPDRRLGVREAYEALDDFGRRAGRLPLLLLLHASVPQSFRADLLNLLKVNFLGTEAGTDLTIDADVLLSAVVQPAAAGYYRLDPEVRRHALALLDATYREQQERRSVQVARFVLAYADALEREATLSLDALLAEYIAVQRWVGLAFTDPPAAAEAFARAIQQGTEMTPSAARLRLGGVTAAVSIPLSGHQELLAYARGIGALASGDRETAERLLGSGGDEELQVGDVTLRSGRTLLRGIARSPQESGQAAQTPRPPMIGLPDPVRVIGREREIAQLRDLLTSPGRREELIAGRNPAALSHAAVVSLVAPPGGGKWTIARQIVSESEVFRLFQDGIVWIDESGAGHRSTALKAYAEVVGATNLFDADDNVDRDRFRELFAKRRVLFVAEADSSRSLLPTLYAAGPACVVVRLIDRPPTDPTLAVVLPRLAPLEAAHFLAASGVSPEAQPAELVAFAQGNPLLLHLLASLVTTLPSGNVVDHLQRFGKSSGDAGVPGRVAWIVAMVWESLPEEIRRETSALVRALGDRTTVTMEDLPAGPATIDALQRAGLLTRSGSSARLHRLVKDALAGAIREESNAAAPRFTCDVFVSYAHLDNIELVEGRKGWVANFARALEIRLGQLLGREVTLYRDAKLAGNDLVPDESLALARGAATFVLIVSPRSVKSEWTRRELKAFIGGAGERGGLLAGNASRLFKVMQTPVPVDEQPDEIRSLLGYDFFRIDPASGRVRELNEVFGPESERDFWLKLDDLAHDISTLLEQLERAGGGSPAGGEEPAV
jgi:hypothetical protein